MKTNTLDRCIWIFIYGGLLIVVIGLSAISKDDVLAWWLLMLGGMMALLGFTGIYVRSRMKTDKK
jgi:predicted membrane channel-forming protein YqfA (hemolysin III family)